MPDEGQRFDGWIYGYLDGCRHDLGSDLAHLCEGDHSGECNYDGGLTPDQD